MSPGGAKPLTSPTWLSLRPTRFRSASKSSSCSTPWMTPSTHQVTWSWIRVICPGRQTRATIENEPSGSTCRVWPRSRRGSRGAARRSARPGRAGAGAAARRRAGRCRPSRRGGRRRRGHRRPDRLSRSTGRVWVAVMPLSVRPDRLIRLMPTFTPVHRYARYMLDVTRLRVLDALARLGSVTAAAKELHYTQPTVSHHLARLEAETGAQLLQRAGRGVRLTPAGQLLADRAAEIIGRIDAADAELAAHVGLTAGRVRLASFSSVIGSLVPRAVAALTSKHPGLQIGLTEHPATRGAGTAAHRQDRRRDHLPLRRDRTRTGRHPPAPPARRSAVPAVHPRRAHARHDARRHLDRRLRPMPQPPPVRCAPTRGSSPGSATPPRTWS